MSNVIDFRKRKEKKKTGQFVSRFISQTEYFWNELDDKRMLIDVVMENAAEELQQRGYDPDAFILDKYAFYDFLGEPLWETYVDESGEGPGFIAFQENDIIYMQTYILIDAENAYTAFQFFKLPDYERGNRAWQIYDQESEKWEKGPGRDFFDLEKLLEQKP